MCVTQNVARAEPHVYVRGAKALLLWRVEISDNKNWKFIIIFVFASSLFDFSKFVLKFLCSVFHVMCQVQFSDTQRNLYEKICSHPSSRE